MNILFSLLIRDSLKGGFPIPFLQPVLPDHRRPAVHIYMQGVEQAYTNIQSEPDISPMSSDPTTPPPGPSLAPSSDNGNVDESPGKNNNNNNNNGSISPAPNRVRWKKILGIQTGVEDKSDRLNDFQQKREKWSLGILNDKQTDEVPGKSFFRGIVMCGPVLQTRTLYKLIFRFLYRNGTSPLLQPK